MTALPTRVIQIDPHAPEEAILIAAAAVIARGGLVAFPTETVYGLGANALDVAAVAGIYEAKGRPEINPLIVHVCDEAMLNRVVAEWPDHAKKLAARFWPGPLTLVVAKNPIVPDLVTAGGSTVAVRMPSHPIALGLIRAAGVPLAAPSANRSNAISPTLAEHVLAGLTGRIELILDGGPCTDGIESTVVDLSEAMPRLLRPGPISLDELQACIGAIGPRGENSETLRSPGQMRKHYSPQTPIKLFNNRAELDRERMKLGQRGQRVLTIVLGGDEVVEGQIAMPTSSAGYASQLYRVFHEQDARGGDCLLIELPPERDEWLAVRDRLTRAGEQFSVNAAEVGQPPHG